MADTLTMLGRVALVQGDLEAARTLFVTSLASAMKISDKLSIAPALEGLADVAGAG